jgi:hypothetical protein
LWLLSGGDGFQLVCSRLYSFLIDLEFQVFHLRQAERQLQSMLLQLNKQFMEDLQLLFMILSMNQQIVDVGQDVGELVDDDFQKFLKRLGCSN